LERLKDMQPSLRLTKRNILKLYLIAVMTSVKFWEDEGLTNDHWATIAGLTTQVRLLSAHRGLHAHLSLQHKALTWSAISDLFRETG
jgi:hypothetical protein